MREPGDLEALNTAGLRGWNDRIARILDRVLGDQNGNPFVCLAADPLSTEVTGADWTGLPERIAACLTRRHALELLDWSEDPDENGRQFQEEYIEWRVVRDDVGNVRRVELTTELGAYWRELAAHDPEETLRLVAEFARESAVPPSAVYGELDNPLAPGITPQKREDAFRMTMLPSKRRSPYNGGVRAICCLVQESNTLTSLLGLVVAAARPLVVKDPSTGRLRCMTAAEAIPRIGAGQLGRSSDPVLVERLIRLAYEGRQIAFDDPLGIYIQDIEHTRLRQPDGSPVPREWFRFGRGRGPEGSSDGRARYQRLVFEVPDGEGLCVGDLIDTATEQRLRFGGQVAELVQLTVFVRVSGAGVLPVDLGQYSLAPETLDAADCKPVSEAWHRFVESHTGGSSTAHATT